MVLKFGIKNSQKMLVFKKSNDIIKKMSCNTKKNISIYKYISRKNTNKTPEKFKI
jgi:hypothetical protein